MRAVLDGLSTLIQPPLRSRHPLDFGKLPNVDRVDFTLQPDPEGNGEFLASQRLRKASECRLSIGLAGWSDKDFVGKLYPKGARPAEFLKYQARAFPTNELNSTYYGVDRERIRRWAGAVPANFRFCPKLPKAITHDLELRGTEAAMGDFEDALREFGGTLGCVWGVLPPGFGPDRLGDLDRFLQRWAPRMPLAFELRHGAWFSQPQALDRAIAVMADHGAIPILTDVAGRRDVLHMRLAGRGTMIRFVGNGLHPSDFTRLDAWIQRLASWAERGLDHAWFFLHQPRDPLAVDLATYLARRMAERTGLELLPNLPEPGQTLPPDGPVQHELF